MWIPVLCHKDLIPPAQMCYVPAALGLKAQQERSEMQFYMQNFVVCSDFAHLIIFLVIVSQATQFLSVLKG